MNTSTIEKILLISLFIMMVLLIWKYLEEQETYNRVPLSNNNYITNHTEFSFLDTTLSVTLDAAEISGVSVIIKNLSPDVRSQFEETTGGVHLQAAIIGRGNQYIIYVYNINRMNAIRTISHETIHLMQYRSDRIQILSDSKVLWEGDTLTKETIYNIPYQFRPWEKEAFDGEGGLSEKVETILYGKNM